MSTEHDTALAERRRLGIEMLKLKLKLLTRAFEFEADVLRLIFVPPVPEPELTDALL